MDDLLSSLPYWIEAVSLLLQVFGVAVIIVGIAAATFGYLIGKMGWRGSSDGISPLRIRIGKTLLLGLEILVAADIIKTVTVELNLVNLTSLGLLVVIRTMLSWTLVVEIEERWPWQKEKRD
ncbi:DUF1622 domain-containing protein [Candidatus Methanocrinis alkalitolerans]|nr:DUF1622 domain-containing protein [Candidatus Methanocrinis alkalitolerans]